jgi:hypothetical protein
VRDVKDLRSCHLLNLPQDMRDLGELRKGTVYKDGNEFRETNKRQCRT